MVIFVLCFPCSIMIKAVYFLLKKLCTLLRMMFELLKIKPSFLYQLRVSCNDSSKQLSVINGYKYLSVINGYKWLGFVDNMNFSINYDLLLWMCVNYGACAQDQEQYRFGKTKIFFRAGQVIH